MNQKRTIIIAVAVLAAAVGGLFMTGMIGGGKPDNTKVTPETITLSEPFLVNLADTDEVHIAKLGVAVQLEPMKTLDHDAFTGANAGGGHGGGGDTKTGPMRVAEDPELRDAVLDSVSRFTAAELLSPEGKERLKKDLLVRFDKVAQRHPVAHGKDAHHDMAAPPYHVADVFFPEYVIQ
jgi:flagellar basal body-associated protein FliL